MHHRIIEDDEPESYALEPLSSPEGRLAGLSLAIRTRLWQEFLSRPIPWDESVRSHLRSEWQTIFWSVPANTKPGQRFGFRRGVRIGSTDDAWTKIDILFQKEERRYFAASLNLHWILDFLNLAPPQSPLASGALQLFDVRTIVTTDPRIHGFPVWVTVGKHCANRLESMGPRTDFPEARRLIAETWRRRGWSPRADWMQAHVREKGILQISAGGDCNCLGQNPDERYSPAGYTMGSHNTDNALNQVALLVGLAQIWKELRTGS